MKSILCIAVCVVMLVSCKGGASNEATADSGVPHFAWMDTVGAHTYPSSDKVFHVNAYGAVGDAVKNCTEAIQKAIDAAEAAGGGKVTFAPGMYLTGSIFVGNNVNLEIPHGTTLLGSENIEDYKKIDTRVAGVEMNWPSALINIIGKSNAAISGDGVVDGRGKVFWQKYFAMREEYNPKGLRWIVDYDCERPRGILISDCKNITVKDIALYRPGFWSLHILYSQSVTVDGVIISNNIEMKGPSTDGIDIDSSSSILVQNCNINCNDDNFCLKAGRDSDGLRVNRPCEYVLIRNCVAGYGHGLFTCGSETSGGIRHIVAHDLKASGTGYGLRFKSTFQRGGTIEDIYLFNIEMDSVVKPFGVDLNWHPTYSNSKLPEGYNYDELPIHWKKMLEQVPEEKGIPKFRNIHLQNVTARNSKYCILCVGHEKSTLDGFTFKNVRLEGETFGSLEHTKDWDREGLVLVSADGTKE